MKASHSRARAKAPRVKWVMQTGAPGQNGGCGIACLAMLMDTDYNRIRELAPEFCEKCGIADDTLLDQFLSEHGFATQRVWKWKEYNNSQREIWPPKPWADRHLCSVVQTEEDVFGHFVVMDGKGQVYDPADEKYTPCDLTRYFEVEWVAGVYRTGR